MKRSQNLSSFEDFINENDKENYKNIIFFKFFENFKKFIKNDDDDDEFIDYEKEFQEEFSKGLSNNKYKQYYFLEVSEMNRFQRIQIYKDNLPFLKFRKKFLFKIQ